MSCQLGPGGSKRDRSDLQVEEAPAAEETPVAAIRLSVFIFFMEFLESKLTALVGCHVSLCT